MSTRHAIGQAAVAVDGLNFRRAAVARDRRETEPRGSADRLHESFVASHLIGPFFAVPICVTLLAFDKTPDATVFALILGIALFWLFPMIARRGASQRASAFASVQLLTLVSLFGSYHYGGLNSAFTVWLLVSVLLSFLYVSSALRACLAGIALQCTIFLALHAADPSPSRMTEAQTGILFLASTLAAALCIALIAAFYAKFKVEGSRFGALAIRYRAEAGESERLIAALEQSNRDLAEFTSSASHELRTSLNVVIGYSELLTENAEVEERWARLRNLERVIASSRRMIGLIGDINRQAESQDDGSLGADASSITTAQLGNVSSADARRRTLRPALGRGAIWGGIVTVIALLMLGGFSLRAGIGAQTLLLAPALLLGWQAARMWGRKTTAEQQDVLTGLRNRTSFQHALGHRLQRDQTMVAVLIADLDGFKDINDSLGHDIGDRLLAAVAARLIEISPPVALLARLGGDEFGIAIFGPDAEAATRQCADAIIEAMTSPFLVDDNQLTTAISVGIAVGETRSITTTELLRQSDIAMYRAKQDKRCPVRSFEVEMDEALSFKRTMRQDLTQAISENQLELHLQPVVDARTGEIRSAEALLRWTHPVLGPVSPAKLVALAEESGQIVGIDDWVLERALDYVKRLGTVPVAVNVSPVQFRHPGFARKIVDQLAAHAVPSSLLRLEITEGVLVTHTRAAGRAIAELREAGLKIALDDFGTGFSSLGYLRDFAFDLLKIDRSFVGDLERGRQGSELLRAIVDLGHSLGMEVIAEGVETQIQAGLVQLLGCDYIQGYFTGRPLAIDGFEQLLTTSHVAIGDAPITPLAARL